MFLLSSNAPARDPAELADSIRAGIEEQAAAGGAPPVVRATGESVENLERLEVRMDGVAIDPSRRPVPGKRREPGPRARRFAFGGRGMRVGSVALDLALAAEDVRFETARDERGRAILVPAGAGAGTAELFVPREGLEALLGEGIRAKAGSADIPVENVVLALENEDDAVRCRLTVTVKKIFTAVVRVAGRLSAGTGASLRLTGVTVKGDGMAGKMVAKMARPQVETLDGREFSLRAFLPPGLAPRDLDLEAADGLRIRALLGPAGDGR